MFQMSLPDPTQPVDDECSQFLSQCEIENVWGMLTLLTEKLCVKQCIGEYFYFFFIPR